MEKILEALSLEELASLLGYEYKGENVIISDVAGVEDVQAGEMTWAENEKVLSQALESPASALLISSGLYEQEAGRISKPCVLTDNPRYAFARALGLFYTRRIPEKGIADTAFIKSSVQMGKDVYVGDYAVIDEDARIGNGAIIYPHVYLGPRVEVGEGAIIYPFVSVYGRTRIGKNVIIHSGTVIGADGFGFVEVGGLRYKLPQVGVVQLEDDVEIGANVTIDRATTGVTLVGQGSKIDNLVQIGHNCTLGKNCIMVSHSGIAGSCHLGDNVTLAAQAGLAPHITIGSNTVVAGRGGVTHDIPANQVVSGFPAKPHREAQKIMASVQRLPYTLKTIRQMEARITELEKKLNEMMP